jgi:hypothetical protein
MKANNRLIPVSKLSMTTTIKRYLFVKRQLQNILSPIENLGDDSTENSIPHVHFYKKHKSHIFPRFETL